MKFQVFFFSEKTMKKYSRLLSAATGFASLSQYIRVVNFCKINCSKCNEILKSIHLICNFKVSKLWCNFNLLERGIKCSRLHCLISQLKD